MGKMPDPERMRVLNDQLDEFLSAWETMTARLHLSDDFQSRELFLMISLSLEAQGQSIDKVRAVMRWQSQHTYAILDGRTPPPLPDIDLSGMANSNGGFASLAQPRMSAPPVDAAALESDVVRAELSRLETDHRALVDMGIRFGTFDPQDKSALLDDVQSVEERWDIVIARFELTGALNPTFVEESQRFLDGMGIGAGGFRDLLKSAHDRMRDAAEKELL